MKMSLRLCIVFAGFLFFGNYNLMNHELTRIKMVFRTKLKKFLERIRLIRTQMEMASMTKQIKIL